MTSISISSTGTSKDLKELRELAKSSATGTQTAKTDGQKDLSIGEADKIFNLMAKDGVITQDEIDVVNEELKACNTKISISHPDINNPSQFKFTIDEATKKSGNERISRANSVVIAGGPNKASVAECQTTTDLCNKKTEGKTFSEIPVQDKLWQIFNGDSDGKSADPAGRWGNGFKIDSDGPKIDICEKVKANLVALKVIAGEKLTEEEQTISNSTAGKTALTQMKKMPEGDRGKLLSSLKDEVGFADTFNKRSVTERNMIYKNVLMSDFKFQGALVFKTEDEFAEAMLKSADPATINKCPGANKQEKEQAFMEMSKVVFRMASTGTPQPLSDDDKKSLNDAQKDFNKTNQDIKNKEKELRDYATGFNSGTSKERELYKGKIETCKKELESLKAKLPEIETKINNFLKYDENTIKMLQASIYYINPEISKASNQNTEMSTKEKVTLPGTNIKVPAGDGEHGRSTQLTTRMLMSEKALPANVQYVKTEDKDHLKDIIPDNAQVEILLDNSGSMQNNVTETNASVTSARTAHPSSTINTQIYTYNSALGAGAGDGTAESAIISAINCINTKFPNPPKVGEKSREIIIMTDANREYDANQLQSLIDKAGASKVNVTLMNPSTGTRLTLDQIKMMVCGTDGKVDPAKLDSFKTGAFLNYNQMMPGYGTEG